ncbi:YtpR family tRNA-binding protein [Ligilactobacillus faecis]|uniref:YtpR family tRNA-binding protein n=1 Tax=Ligilactobacillus faecis TaxID=762833 RepID=A0ABV4DQM4_9LACO
MLITSYNPAQMGDVLVAITKPDVATQATEKKEKIVRIYDVSSNETLGYNFFEVSELLSDLTDQGQVFLTEKQVAILNEALSQAGFEAELTVDMTPKFVVGHVAELAEHPDSDHLHIAKVEVDNGETLQIVCGAPNIEAGQNVVVAKVGAMMPNGALIWPGKLRGVDSFGMLCAARELALPNAPKARGILILDPAEFKVGTAFDFAKGARLFA